MCSYAKNYLIRYIYMVDREWNEWKVFANRGIKLERRSYKKDSKDQCKGGVLGGFQPPLWWWWRWGRVPVVTPTIDQLPGADDWWQNPCSGLEFSPTRRAHNQHTGIQITLYAQHRKDHWIAVAQLQRREHTLRGKCWRFGFELHLHHLPSVFEKREEILVAGSCYIIHF